jgi:hypothetical protein
MGCGNTVEDAFKAVKQLNKAEEIISVMLKTICTENIYIKKMVAMPPIKRGGTESIPNKARANPTLNYFYWSLNKLSLKGHSNNIFFFTHFKLTSSPYPSFYLFISDFLIHKI